MQQRKRNKITEKIDALRSLEFEFSLLELWLIGRGGGGGGGGGGRGNRAAM